MASEAVRAVVSEVLSALEPLGHPCALVGGLALAVWNYPRATRDVDLLIAVELADLDAVVEQLGKCGFRPKKEPPLVTVDGLRLLQFLFTPQGEFYDVQVDLLLAETDFQKSAVARRVPREVAGIEGSVDVLQCDDLVLLKLLARRMIDRADAAAVLRENRQAIDVDYLHSWIGKLGLKQEFGEIWREAFPGEDSPQTTP